MDTVLREFALKKKRDVNGNRGGRGSLFLRLFGSIMAITLAILLVQILLVWYMFSKQSKEFQQSVFSSFTQRLQETLDSGTRAGIEWSLQTIQPILKIAADDKISGLILRDSIGSPILSYGKTPKGVAIPEMQDEKHTELPERSWFVTPSITRLYAHPDSDGRIKTVVMPHYPQPVRSQDIVGTVLLYSDAEKSKIFGSVDVLVFSPMTYSITALIVTRMITAFSITIPIALIIALFGAQIIARYVSKQAGRFAHILQDISKGDYTQPVPSSTMNEFAHISSSVEILGKQLASHERMRQQWLQGIAHDLNTPVTALKLSIEGMIDNVLPFTPHVLKNMKIEIEELERRVGSVLMLSSMEDPDFHVKKEHIDILEFTDEVINSSLSNHKVCLDIEVEHIVGDRRLLVMICRELIRNGSKYASTHDPLHWKIATATSPYSYIMEFCNHGKLDEVLIEHAFEPWYRADSSRSQKGSGLGLSIVRQVMEVHKGIATMQQRDDVVVVTVLW